MDRTKQREEEITIVVLEAIMILVAGCKLRVPSLSGPDGFLKNFKFERDFTRLVNGTSWEAGATTRRQILAVGAALAGLETLPCSQAAARYFIEVASDDADAKPDLDEEMAKIPQGLLDNMQQRADSGEARWLVEGCPHRGEPEVKKFEGSPDPGVAVPPVWACVRVNAPKCPSWDACRSFYAVLLGTWSAEMNAPRLRPKAG